VHDPRAYLLEGVAGHAGLFSTAEDLAVYAQMLLGEGTYHGVQVFKPETVRAMFARRKVPGNHFRALGWDAKSGFSSNRGTGLSEQAVGHGGFTGTVIWIDPKLDLFYIFLSNRVHPDGKGNVNRLAGAIGTVVVESVLATE
jgi:CubicO group peptidase (beta-lactamase class C family)